MKSNRHEAIITIIKDSVITTQDELLERLKADGYDVTQATVSRDIKELRLIKSTDAAGNQRYTVMDADAKIPPKFVNIFESSVLSIENAMNDVVIKCYSGMANAACAAIDNMNMHEIVGTLAGDDTIFVITHSEADAVSLVNKLNGLKK